MGISRRKWIVGGWLVAAALPVLAMAQPAPDVKPANVKPVAPETAPGGNSTMQQVLDRLNKVEKELDAIKKSGKVPLDKKDQRLIVGLETPYLGSPYYSQTNPRVFAARLLFVNLTDQKIALKWDDIKLEVDGTDIQMKDLNPQWQHQPVQIGNQSIALRTMVMAKEVLVPSGGNAGTWVLFQDLQAGNHVPDLKLKIKTGTVQKELDINALQREVLGLKVERIGPGKCLGLVTISGMIDSINVGTLVDEVDKLTSDKVTRIVIRWTDQAPLLDNRVYSWLSNTANAFGWQPMGEMEFPSLPISIREFNLANMPNEMTRNMMRSRGQGFSFSPDNPQRIFGSDVEAVVSALQSAYEMVPRDELTLAIQNGSRLEKVAALMGGGGRLPADKLPMLIQLADDNDPVMQQAALTALAHFGEKEAVEKLLFYARKNLPRLSETAIGSLASSRFAVAQEAVLELLKNETPEGKKAIVRLLAKHPRPMWSDAIYQYVKGQNQELGVEALRALVQVGHPQLMTVLKESLASTQPGMREEAFARLAERTDRDSEKIAIEYALEQLKTQPMSESVRVLLNRTKDKRALPLLWRQYDRTPNKSNLLQTLALIGDQETVRELLNRYPRMQEYEKGETIKILAKLSPTEFRKLAILSINSNTQVMSYAIQGLQDDGGPDSIKILAEALEKSPHQNVWMNVCNALGMLGTPVGRAALVKARDSGIPEKRNAAHQALLNMMSRSPGYGYYINAKQQVKESRWKEALEQFENAIQADPEFSEAFSGRGNVYLQDEKKLDLAARDFAKATEIDAYNHEGLTGLCLVMVMKDGKYVEAIKKVEDSRSKFGDNNIYRYNVACVYARAVEHLQKTEKAPDREKLMKEYSASALKELQGSIQSGFQELDWMQKDPDLKSLQGTPEFKKLVEDAKVQGRGVGNAIRGPRRVRGGLRNFGPIRGLVR